MRKLTVFACIIAALLTAAALQAETGSKSAPAGSGVLASYSDIAQGYQTIADGFQAKSPDQILGVLSPEQRSKSETSIRALFPGNQYGPSAVYYIKSVKKQGSEVLVQGFIYKVIPQKDGGNADGYDQFADVWTKSKSDNKWRVSYKSRKTADYEKTNTQAYKWPKTDVIEGKK